jgi:asparagine synthase (glutamine-hydrolysing)
MSVIFGILKQEGNSVSAQELADLGIGTERYAPDGLSIRENGRIGMGFQPYHTHRRSNLEAQPAVDTRGNMLTFDGRLDNYKKLSTLLDMPDDKVADSQIVLAAFEKWGEGCFAKFVGDWSIALWSAQDRSLYLSCDHAGVRTLYFDNSNGTLRWSTYPDTFIQKGTERALEETFIACYLLCEPTRDLTPYRGIQAVTPAHYFIIRNDNTVVKKPHWQWIVEDKIHYRTDEEYSEHFLSSFRQAVERRTGPGTPILAQLSGGMDSTAIVCMSDHIRREQGAATHELLDTVSYYDDSEPNWNEKPYFTLVEEKRGKRGVHISTSALDRSFLPPPHGYPFPGADSRSPLAENEFEKRIGDGKYRVIISGLGGDELLGGPPNPLPELADYLVSGQMRRFFRQSFQWCLPKRIPLIYMVPQVIRFAFGLYPRLPVPVKRVPPWISDKLRDQYLTLKASQDRSLTLNLLPTAIDNGLTWWNMLETLTHRFHASTIRREFRYPYLDRDLVDFLLRVPVDQLLKPGRRRFMMRGSLRHILPSEVLERRRKAYVSRGPLRLIPDNRAAITNLMDNSLLAQAGCIQREKFRSVLDRMDVQSTSEWQASMMRTINLELWLRSATTEFSLDKDYASGRMR